MKRKMTHRVLVWPFMLAISMSVCFGFTASAQEAKKSSASGLINPVVEADSGMDAGQKVTWDCVWFGSYPQAEIVSSKKGYTGVIESALREGDIIADSTLHGALEKASEWDEKDEITLDGQRYRRMKKDAATPIGGGDSRYNWSDREYHYFKYEPVKWRVLRAGTDQALLLSDTALDCQSYNEKLKDVTWETCTIRSWLNGYGGSFNQQGTDYTDNNFIGSAFSPAEQSAIAETDVVNADNLEYGTEGGNDTKDRIFLLSEAEVYGDSAAEYGFISPKTKDEARCCKSSTYAKARSAYIFTEDDRYSGNSIWGLRSPGVAANDAANVNWYGVVYNEGYIISGRNDSVRAALTLNLSSDQYSYAGTVCSDGTEDEIAYAGAGSEEEGYLSLKEATVTFLSHGDNYYTGQPQCPEFIVSYDGKRLVEGQDYTVSCTNNIGPSFDPHCVDCYGSIYDSENIKEKYAKIAITGKYPYKDTIVKSFLISGFFDLTGARGYRGSYDYTGRAVCPKPEIFLYDGETAGAVLKEDVDYRLSYSDNTEPGKATILVTGIGKYEGYGSWHIHFFISSKDIGDYEVLLSADGKKYAENLPEDTYTADGKAKKPYVHVTPVIQKDGSYVPVDSSYYNVAYENNVNAGTATVRITGRPPYIGSVTRTFTIGQGESDLDRFTYQFGNTREDFGYPADYSISEKSIFTRLWGNTVRAQNYYDIWTKEFGKWNGNCYGMSATSIMFNDVRDDIEVAGFNARAARVKELELDDYNRKNNIRMSLLDFIESMQVSQVDDTVSYIVRRANKGQIGRMCKELEKAQKGDTAVIIVLDSSEPGKLHSVAGYGMEDVSDTERRIHVYDCNHPGKQKYITLTMKDGACTGWYYDGSTDRQSLVWTSEKSGGVSCTISFISYDSFVKVWLNRSLDNVASEKNVMMLNTKSAVICDKAGKELAVLKDGEIESENEEIYEYYPICASGDGTDDRSKIKPLIFLPADEYIVKNTDKGVDGMEMSMCNVNRMITVSTSAPSVSVCVDDSKETNIVQMNQTDGRKETVRAAFHSSNGLGKYKTVSYTGNTAGSSMSLGVIGGKTVEEGFHVVDKEVVEKDENASGDKPSKDPSAENPPGTEKISFELVSSTGSAKIAAGRKAKLKIVTSGSGRVQGLKFKSSNPKAVSVSQKGVVSAKKKAGGKSAVITAADSRGNTAKVKIKVMKGAVKKVKVTGKNSCKAGKSLKLKAKVSAGKGANKTVVWKSSAPQYAEVSKKGVVKTKKKGKGKKVKITAAATDGSKKSGSIKIRIK